MKEMLIKDVLPGDLWIDFEVVHVVIGSYNNYSVSLLLHTGQPFQFRAGPNMLIKVIRNEYNANFKL